MLKSRLWDYSHEYILASRAITINGAEDDDNAKRLDKINKEVISKNCAPFTDCISEINNTQIDNAKDLDVVMLMYNSIIIWKHQEVCGNITEMIDSVI